MSDRKKKPLIVFQSAPYEGSIARSALDMALAFAVFAQEPTVAFCGDAVLSLKDGQNPGALGRKSLRKIIDSLPLYDLDIVYVDQDALVRSGMNSAELPAFAVTLSSEELKRLIQEAGHVISL